MKSKCSIFSLWILILCISMDYPVQINTISNGLPDVYFKGLW